MSATMTMKEIATGPATRIEKAVRRAFGDHLAHYRRPEDCQHCWQPLDETDDGTGLWADEGTGFLAMVCSPCTKAFDVTCPRCGAVEGSECGGRSHYPFHLARYKAAGFDVTRRRRQPIEHELCDWGARDVLSRDEMMRRGML